jgi:hypothetical protein
VQTNKEDSKALSDRAALLTAVVVRELMKLDEETLKHRVVDVNELLLCVLLMFCSCFLVSCLPIRISQDIKDSHQRRSEKGRLRRTLNKEKDKEEIKKLSLRLDKAVERFNVSLATSIICPKVDVFPRSQQMSLLARASLQS